MGKNSFTAQLRDFDDSGLDPYQFRLLMHYWRVGTCWETVRTTAEKCKMSIGKVSEAKQQLIDSGLIEHTLSKNGKVAVKVCSPHEQRSPHDEQRSPHEQNPVVVVHHMNAILNEPININEQQEGGGSDFSKIIKAYENNIAEITSYTSELIQDAVDKYPADWIIEAINIAVENNARRWKYIDGILRNWKANGKGDNQNGSGAKPDYRPLWNQVKAEMSKNGRRSKHQWNGQIAPVLKKAGGYLRLCSLSLFDAEQTFKNAYKDAT